MAGKCHQNQLNLFMKATHLGSDTSAEYLKCTITNLSRCTACSHTSNSSDTTKHVQANRNHIYPNDGLSCDTPGSGHGFGTASCNGPTTDITTPNTHPALPLGVSCATKQSLKIAFICKCVFLKHGQSDAQALLTASVLPGPLKIS